jgi:hypothetical protein
VSPRLTFSQYLVGNASLERPSFFYAYAGMWLHLIVGSALVLLFTQLPAFLSLPSIIVGSFCLGILIYGLMAREFGLFLNLLSYASSMGRIFYPDQLSTTFLLVPLLIALVSGYLLLSREYKHYSRDIFADDLGKVPPWISLIMGGVVIFLCVYGLYLI